MVSELRLQSCCHWIQPQFGLDEVEMFMLPGWHQNSREKCSTIPREIKIEEETGLQVWSEYCSQFSTVFFSECLLGQPFPQPFWGVLSNKNYEMAKVFLYSAEALLNDIFFLMILSLSSFLQTWPYLFNLFLTYPEGFHFSPLCFEG